MKRLTLFIIAALAAILLMNTVAAVTNYAEWQNGNSFMIINEGESAYFDVGIFSMSPPMTYSIKMYNSTGNLIHTYKDNVRDDDGWYSERIMVTEQEYGQSGGNFFVIISSTDGIGDSDSYTLNLAVSSVNDAPVLQLPEAITFQEGSSFTLDLDDYVYDLDNLDSELNFTIFEEDWFNVTIDPVTHIVNISIPDWAAGWTGEGIVAITVTDPEGASDMDYMIVNVTNVNDEPVIVSISAPKNINEGEVLSVSFDAYDPDYDSLQYYIYRNGQLVSTSNSHSWQTDYDDAGTYNYTFVVGDGITNVSAERSITVLDSAVKAVSLYILEITPVLIMGKYLEIQNYASSIKDAEIVFSIPSLNIYEISVRDIERNSDNLIQVMAEIPQGTYLAIVEINSRDYSTTEYLIVEN